MKNTIKLAILMIVFIGMATEAKADSKPKNRTFEKVVIIQREGRANADGTVTYDRVKTDIKMREKALYIYCTDEGDQPCPVNISIFVTAQTGLNYSLGSAERAIQLVKTNISQNQDKGKLVHNGMLYQWQNGKVHENGAIEMELKAVPLNTIIR